jgi:rhodanese-related sulfurtransferase
MNVISKYIVSLSIITCSLWANGLDLKNGGVSISFEDDNGDKQHYTIKRITNEKCKSVNGANPEVIWSGNYANKNVPNDCKKTFVTTIGKISPIKISKNIQTVGELEVIDFIKKSQKNKNLLLVDARMPSWYEKMTIPTAENIPFNYFNPKKYATDFEDTMDTIGIEQDDKGNYDFSEAKTLLIFCNGSWCLQSVLAIKNLKMIGYPEEKLLWYRGGMYSWKLLNLTTITP